jgi:energy-converting hydrogenase Eha subunit G
MKKDFFKKLGIIGWSLNILALIIFFVSPASLLVLIIPGAILCLIATIGYLPEKKGQ